MPWIPIKEPIPDVIFKAELGPWTIVLEVDVEVDVFIEAVLKDELFVGYNVNAVKDGESQPFVQLCAEGCDWGECWHRPDHKASADHFIFKTFNQAAFTFAEWCGQTVDGTKLERRTLWQQ